MAGKEPFKRGELFHFVDPWLCDPLMSRLPVKDPEHWRIGHYTRAIPDGYFETLAFGGSRLQHDGVARFYETLRTALREPLWSGPRLRAAFSLLTGQHGDDLQAYVRERYRRPEPRPVNVADLLAQPWPEQSFWFDEPRSVVLIRGASCALSEARTARRLRLFATPFVTYHVRLQLAGQDVGTHQLAALRAPAMPTDDASILPFLYEVMGLTAIETDLGGEVTFDRVIIDGEVLADGGTAAFAGVAFDR